MANVRTSIDIAVPPERVWELVTDLERLGEWVSIHRDLPEPPAVAPDPPPPVTPDDASPKTEVRPLGQRL